MVFFFVLVAGATKSIENIPIKWNLLNGRLRQSLFDWNALKYACSHSYSQQCSLDFHILIANLHLYSPSIRMWIKIFPDDSANISVTHKQPRTTINEFDWKIYYKRSRTALLFVYFYLATLIYVVTWEIDIQSGQIIQYSSLRNGYNKMPKSW